MRWKIGDYVFCEQHQTLSKDDQECVIEPMLVTLLAYFCAYPNQIISRQTLVDEVWGGRIVSDSAVNRAITKLRKCFHDDPKQPRYIATFPKKGYRFIATVIQINESDIAKLSVANTSSVLEHHIDSQPKRRIVPLMSVITILILTFVTVVTVFSYLKTSNESSLPFQRMKPLTLEAGDEFFPEFSSDGKYFSYSKVKNGVMTSWIKQVATGQMIAIGHDDLDQYWLGPVSWSRDSSRIAYLVTTKQECAYFIREVTGMVLSSPKRIYQCRKGSAGKISFLHDNKRLVFAEITGDNKRYQLFEINLQNNHVVKLKQPPPLMAGNTQFDVHPSENKLLISSPNQQQWMEFSVLDVDNNELTMLFKKDAYICCGIWSHDGQHVVLMGEHPSKQLLSYDLQGGNQQLLLNSNKILFRPVRHSNGQDYLFSLDESNQDLFMAPLGDATISEKRVIADSSVDDRLGRLSPNTENTAFISLRTEQEQIWLYDHQQRKQTQLTNFNNNPHFFDLAWSPDGTLLAALTLNHLYVITVDDKQVIEIPIEQKEVAGVSFKSNQTLAFSLYDDKQWQVYLYDLQSKHTETLDKQWKYVDFSAADGQGLWLNQKSQLFRGGVVVENADSLSRHFLHHRRFNLKYHLNDWYYIDFMDSQLKLIQRNSHQEMPIAKSVYSFDIRQNQLSFSKELQHNADLYTTN